jgi:hypothetical protein
VPHGPEACYGSWLHCFAHDVDEPVDDPYRVCFECHHAFPSAEVLLAEHNTVLAAASPGSVETDVTQVFTCPHCVHDF